MSWERAMTNLELRDELRRRGYDVPMAVLKTWANKGMRAYVERWLITEAYIMPAGTVGRPKWRVFPQVLTHFDVTFRIYKHLQGRNIDGEPIHLDRGAVSETRQDPSETPTGTAANPLRTAALRSAPLRHPRARERRKLPNATRIRTVREAGGRNAG